MTSTTQHGPRTASTSGSETWRCVSHNQALASIDTDTRTHTPPPWGDASVCISVRACVGVPTALVEPVVASSAVAVTLLFVRRPVWGQDCMVPICTHHCFVSGVSSPPWEPDSDRGVSNYPQRSQSLRAPPPPPTHPSTTAPCRPVDCRVRDGVLCSPFCCSCVVAYSMPVASLSSTAVPPTVRFEHRPDNAHALTPPGQKWTLALVTPDGRSVDTSPNTVKIHWLIENLEAGADVNAMPAAVPYTAVAPHVVSRGPGPLCIISLPHPPLPLSISEGSQWPSDAVSVSRFSQGAGAYRYVFCLLAQTQDVSLDSFDPSSVDFPTFLSEHGMTPVSLAFFQSAATE